MKIEIELTEQEIKKLIKDHITEQFNHRIDSDRINIMVKSKQNYKAEWENACIKAEYKSL